MTGGQKGVVAGLLLAALCASPVAVRAETPPEVGDCRQIVALLNEQNERMSGELRRIQREMAALRSDLDKPGLAEVFAGIGYIVGLFGAAAFVAARRRK